MLRTGKTINCQRCSKWSRKNASKDSHRIVTVIPAPKIELENSVKQDYAKGD